MANVGNEHLIALEAMSNGDLIRAKNLYGELLEKNPEEIDFICGYFTASYWENRKDILHPEKQGREAASQIMKAWDRFESIGEEKKFLNCKSYSAAMRYVFSLASENLRMAFQLQGAGSASDTELLLELSRCLIRIENYPDAIEILQYARKTNRENPRILFMLGEAYLSSEEPELRGRGISLYRDAFFLDPNALEISIITSLPVGEILKELYDVFEEDLKKVCEWLPAYLLADYFLRDLKPMSEKEIEQAVLEIRRLRKDMERVVEEYKSRVKSRISFYSLVLIHHFSYFEKDTSLVREYEGILQETDNILFERYKKNTGR
jgi:tetratricopeptide (TPR) repeat protein